LGRIGAESEGMSLKVMPSCSFARKRDNDDRYNIYISLTQVSAIVEEEGDGSADLE
jgi:hypothetical protein